MIVLVIGIVFWKTFVSALFAILHRNHKIKYYQWLSKVNGKWRFYQLAAAFPFCHLWEDCIDISKCSKKMAANRFFFLVSFKFAFDRFVILKKPFCPRNIMECNCRKWGWCFQHQGSLQIITSWKKLWILQALKLVMKMSVVAAFLTWNALFILQVSHHTFM